MNIAIIPARGGSKRIPRKNIKDFCGKPMIAWPIRVAQSSGLFSHIIVSTDDPEIASVAQDWGAEVPFYRPANLSDDFTGTTPVVAHAIRECEGLGWQMDKICCIYPCAPFIQATDIKFALDAINQSTCAYSFPVTGFPSAIQRSLKLGTDGMISPFYPQYELTRTQDLEPAFYDAGQFYWGAKEAWLHNTRIHSNGLGLVIPNWRVVDIDKPEDWVRAEVIWRSLGSNTN